MERRKYSWDGSSSGSNFSNKLKNCFKRFWSNPGSTRDDLRIVNIYQSPSRSILKSGRQVMTGPNEPEYFTSHPSRGKVYIFNHMNFKKKCTPRDGTDKDVQNLKRSLPKLGFNPEDIKIFDDFTLNEIEEKLEEISKEDHSERDMMIVFVLTHGEQDGKIYAFDRDYHVSELWEHFTADKCETLKGKPKIFFISACKGSNVDDGALIHQLRKPSITETDAVRCQTTVSYRIPIWADFLTIYSTMEGHYSYRNPREGTWYIQALCLEINNFSDHRMHFIDFLTRVNRKVAVAYQTCFDDPRMCNKKQCPFITSSLTKVINLHLRKDTDSTKTMPRPKSYN